MSVALLVLLAGIVAGAVCVLLGIVRVMSTVRPLKARVDAYCDLPIVTLAVTTQTRVKNVQRKLAGMPLLQARAQRALTEIATSFDTLRASGLTLVGALRSLPRRLFAR